MLLAEIALTLKNYDLALRLLTRLSEDEALKKDIYLYSSVLFSLGICHCAHERYDLAYVQFMKANTVWPTATWAPFASFNAATCIEGLEGPELALEQFRKNAKAHKSTDHWLSMAYHAYHLKTVREQAREKELERAKSIIEIMPAREKELTKTAHENAIAVALRTSLYYLNRAFKFNPNDTIVLQFIVSLQQEMDERGITGWTRNDEAFYNLTEYFRKTKQPHKARKIYHDWFEAIERKRLAEGKKVTMLYLLTLEAECYDEMGQPLLALEVLRRQAGLFSTVDKSRLDAIQKKQDALNAARLDKIHVALKPMDDKKQYVSQTMRDSIQASLTQWNTHPSIQSNTGSLRFFTLKESNTNETDKSITQQHPLRPNLSCFF